MPIGKLAVDQTLSLLVSHRNMFGDRAINTHRLDIDGSLRKSRHDCFHGLKVANVLIPDSANTFFPTIEMWSIINTVSHYMEWSSDASNKQYCVGFASASAVQDSIEIALFKLEKLSVKEAKPEVVKKENK